MILGELLESLESALLPARGIELAETSCSASEQGWSRLGLRFDRGRGALDERGFALRVGDGFRSRRTIAAG